MANRRFGERRSGNPRGPRSKNLGALLIAPPNEPVYATAGGMRRKIAERAATATQRVNESAPHPPSRPLMPADQEVVEQFVARLPRQIAARRPRPPPPKMVSFARQCSARCRIKGLRLLDRAADISPSELAEGIAALVRAELVFRRGTPPDANYSFKHALVCDVAYESLLKQRRWQLPSGSRRPSRK